MKVLFINRERSKMNIMAEGIYFYYLYLFAEKAEFNSLLPFTIGTWANSENWTDKFVIEMVHGVAPANTMVTTEEKMLQNLKMVNEIKRQKHKIKEALILLRTFQSAMIYYRKYLREWHEWILKSIYVWNKIELIKESSIQLTDFSKYYVEGTYGDQLILFTNDAIIQRENFLLLDSNVGKYMKENLLEEHKKEAWSLKKTELYSFPLFSIPYGKNIHLEGMRVLRKNLQSKIVSISEKLIEFRTTIQKDNFGDAVKEKINSFFETLKPETETFQKHIDNEMYLRQAVNSDDTCYNAQVRVGVCSVETIARHYGKAKILKSSEANTLKKKLAKQIDIKKCEVFLYISLPENILKTFNPIT